jgi:hypothetical protein
MSPPYAGRPWERPDTEFPAVVPVGTLQFDTAGSSAVAITGLLAYRHGFEFFVTRLFRPVKRKTGPPNPGGPRRGEEPLKIGVEFADGGQAFTGGWVDIGYADEPDRPFVYPGGSMTKPNRMDGRWWVWPLPPPGRLDFICRLGEAETRLSIDAQPILEASHRSTQAWPAEALAVSAVSASIESLRRRCISIS